MSKNANRVLNSSFFLLWQGYKLFSSVRTWNVAICMSKKDCTVEVFSKTVALCYVS